MKYFLPCDCGRSVEIVPGDAGQSVVCACGKSLTAPSMLQIKKLPPAQESATPKRGETGILRKTFLVLGIVLLIPAFLFAVQLAGSIPQPRQVSLKRVFFSYGTNQKPLYQDSTPIPESEHNILWMQDELIDLMMPMELYFYFQTLKEPTFSYNFQDNYQAIKDAWNIWLTADIILIVLAVLSIAVSFFMPKRNAVVTGWSGSEWR